MIHFVSSCGLHYKQFTDPYLQFSINDFKHLYMRVYFTVNLIYYISIIITTFDIALSYYIYLRAYSGIINRFLSSSLSTIFIAFLVTSHAPLIAATQSCNMRQVCVCVRASQKENMRFMISPRASKKRKARDGSRKQIYDALAQSLIEALVFLRRGNKTVSILSVSTERE